MFKGGLMKIAVTVWEDRISPVFDASRRLLIVDIKNTRIGERSVLVFDPEQPSRLVKILAKLDVRVLICGAVSQLPATIIDAADITLIPFITGRVDRVLEAFARGESLEPAFLMPGCHASSLLGNRQTGVAAIDKQKGRR
jgi:predicted Fe-Mo cluster-binding NifX family protein